MKNLKLKHQIYFVLLLIMSCNTTKETKMSDFVEFKITEITNSESSILLVLENSNDPLIFARISKSDFENFEEIKSNLKKDNNIKIKGIIHDIEGSSIIVIQDIIFLE